MARIETTIGGFRPLPPEAPLDMPLQDLGKAPGRPGSRLDWVGLAIRSAIILVTAVVAGGLTMEMYGILAVADLTAIEAVMLGLFAVNITWIAFSFAIASAGFLKLLAGGKRRLEAPGHPHTRTAILLPTYNEDPRRIFGTAVATAEALAEAGADEAFDLFVISDTTDPDIWIAEEAAFLAARASVRSRCQVYYRRRPKNFERKAGNVAEWVRRFGAAYEQFIVFDADSLMSADALVGMAREMERRPDLGLLQTVPMLIGRSTLFARLQQFASRVYGPVLATGLAVWSRDCGNYWGHNAILRTRAFAESAGLPTLRGRAPFGGHIMSHDFVEAALMRRAGWKIVIDPSIEGSYEESPPSLIDLAERDRRWCQGNLQHLGVIGARGLHWVSRVHFATGVMSYLAAPIWLCFLLSGLLLALQANFVRPEYFSEGFSLFPTWPVIDHIRAIGLFTATMAVLLAPKLFGLVVALLSGPVRRGIGGVMRATASVLLETLFSALFAPVMMAIQTRAVGQVLLGRDAGWKAQRRSDGTVPFEQVARRHREHMAHGIALGCSALAVSPALLMWMSPAVTGLLLAIPLSFVTAGSIGALRRAGLLLVPEELSPPRIQQRSLDAEKVLGAEFDGPIEAFALLIELPSLLEFHANCLPGARESARREVDPHFVVGMARLDAAADLGDAAARLSREEKLALLGRPEGVDRLRHAYQRMANAA